MWNIGYYTSPIILTVLYRRGYFVLESISTLAKLTTGISMLVIISLCMRGLGRAKAPNYKRFFRTFDAAKQNPQNEELRKALREFDYEFKHWPVDWSAKQSGKVTVQPHTVLDILKTSTVTGIAAIPYEIAAFIAIHTFGLKMIYPGSLKMFHNYFHPMLVEGRQKIIQEYGGQRNKVETCDDNEIDTIFVDNRAKSVNGKTLVICSEGNAGFYEIGIASTPLELNFSVLGWNHPGFAGSTVSGSIIDTFLAQSRRCNTNYH